MEKDGLVFAYHFLQPKLVEGWFPSSIAVTMRPLFEYYELVIERIEKNYPVKFQILGSTNRAESCVQVS